MDIDGLLEHRKAKDEFFATSHHAPLDHHKQQNFNGLAYFDPNPEMVFNLPVDPAGGEDIKIHTSDGQERTYRRDALVSFEVGGETVTLTMYTTGQPGFFIPFRDGTSGKASYGAGRYLDIEANGDGTVTLDFNLAYNPYCAYSDSYSCPMPPHENWLTIPIEAGEKDWLA